MGKGRASLTLLGMKVGRGGEGGSVLDALLMGAWVVCGLLRVLVLVDRALQPFFAWRWSA